MKPGRKCIWMINSCSLFYTDSGFLWHHHPPSRHCKIATPMGTSFSPSIIFSHLRRRRFSGLINIILDHPILNVMKAQIHTFCNDMIVSLPSGPWTIPGDLPISQSCYHAEIQPPTHSADSSDEHGLNMTPINQFKTFGINVVHLE